MHGLKLDGKTRIEGTPLVLTGPDQRARNEDGDEASWRTAPETTLTMEGAARIAQTAWAVQRRTIRERWLAWAATWVVVALIVGFALGTYEGEPWRELAVLVLFVVSLGVGFFAGFGLGESGREKR